MVSDGCRFRRLWDGGQHWINYLDDTVYSYTCPGFDTSTNGWSGFSASGFFPTYIALGVSDSIFFRFTFISDSVPSNKDGWILDDFSLYYFISSVNDILNDKTITINPNPSDGHIKLQSKTITKHNGIQVYNLQGQKVFETNTLPADGSLYLPLPDGTYILKCSGEKDIAITRLTILH